jgi:arginine decarboxylase-like protein
MTVGERYGWVLNLFKATIQQLNWTPTRIGLMYDIACKFSGFLRKYDPELADKTTMKVCTLPYTRCLHAYLG